jgi:hypothetical protein
MAERDWYKWHRDYDQPGTALARRLAAVQDQIGKALDAAPPGPLHAISLCAGQGRDLIGALARHPRRDDVLARLVPQICDWFAGRGFEPLWVSDPAEGWGVGTHRFAATPVRLERGARMFTFAAYHPDTGPARHRA